MRLVDIQDEMQRLLEDAEQELADIRRAVAEQQKPHPQPPQAQDGGSVEPVAPPARRLVARLRG